MCDRHFSLSYIAIFITPHSHHPEGRNLYSACESCISEHGIVGNGWYFRDECDATLILFEKAEEWADLVKYLARLQRTLNKYASLPWIPDKVSMAKRLYQCLHPALPTGVHLKTLETIELIFSRIGQQRLSRDSGRCAR